MDQYSTWTLFEERYWLDAVAPGQWHAASVLRGGKVIGRLPYVLKRRHGLAAISTPPLTPWLGPWIRPSAAKAAEVLGHQHKILEELLTQLPSAQRALFPCPPEFSNLAVFHWNGFNLKLGYTYRMSYFSDEDVLLKGMRDKTRNLCRKAGKVVNVRQGDNIRDFIGILEKTFERQNMDMSSIFPTLERIDAIMSARKQRAIYFAEDAQGRIHAAAYIVFDKRHSFYLAGGADPELRKSGAQSLILKHAIEDTQGRSEIFDFEGSMMRNVEHFIRGFGAQQVPRFSARKSAGIGKLVDALQMLR